MSWSEWQWQPVIGRRAKRRLHPRSSDADEDDVQLPVDKTESGPGRPQAGDKAKLDKSWLERSRAFFKNPPEWKVKVENTFISVYSWHDRTLRTTLSAPACLMTATALSSSGSPSTREKHHREGAEIPPSNVSTREKYHHERAEVVAGMPKLTSKLPADFPPIPTLKPPAPPLTIDEAEDSPSSSSKFTESNEVRAADEAAGPKRRKPKTKSQCKTTATEATPSIPHAVSTPPVARSRPEPETNDFGMTTVVRGRKRRGHRIQVLQCLDGERGLSACSSQNDPREDDEVLSACSSQNDPREDDEVNLHGDVEKKDPKELPPALPNSHSVSTPVSSPTGKTARRQRKRAAKAAAKANLLTTAKATPLIKDSRYHVPAQCRSGPDFHTELKGFAHYSWPSSRPCAGRAGALQRRQTQCHSVEARLQQFGAAVGPSADSQLKEMYASVSSTDESEIFTLESEDDWNDSPRQHHEQENGAALPPAKEAKAAQAFFVDRGGSFPTCAFVAAGDAAAGNGLCIDQVGKASLSADSGNIEKVIAALVREKGLAGMPCRGRGLSAS